MAQDEEATIGGYVRDPKYRADCIDWFHEPSETTRIQFIIPPDVMDALEEAAERADRTFNAQLRYVIDACRGTRPLDFEDQRPLSEWRALFSQVTMQFHGGEEWYPGSAIFIPSCDAAAGFGSDQNY